MMKQARILLTGSFGFLMISSPGIAGDITGHHRDPFQWRHHVISAAPLDDTLGFAAVYDQSEAYRLLPGDRETSGSLYRTGIKTRFPLSKTLHLGLGIDLINSHLDRDPNQALDRSFSAKGASFQLALRYQLFQFERFHLAMVPSFEPTTYTRTSFALPSKSRLGIIVAGSYDTEDYEIAYNASFRYRPTEILDRYKISHDFSNGLRATAKLNALHLSAELVERNIYVLDSLRRNPLFQKQVGQYHRLGTSYHGDFWSVGLYAQRAIKDKLFGVAEEAVVANFDIRIGADTLRQHQSADTETVVPSSEPASIEEDPNQAANEDRDQPAASKPEEPEFDQNPASEDPANEPSNSSTPVDSNVAIPDSFEDHPFDAPPADTEAEKAVDEDLQGTDSENADSKSNTVLPTPVPADEEETQELNAPESEPEPISPEQMLKDLQETRQKNQNIGNEMDGFQFAERTSDQSYKSPAERIQTEHDKAESELQAIEQASRRIEAKARLEN